MTESQETESQFNTQSALQRIAASTTWITNPLPVLAKDHLRLDRRIGSGQSGLVHTGYLLAEFEAPRPVAIKQLKKGEAMSWWQSLYVKRIRYLSCQVI